MRVFGMVRGVCTCCEQGFSSIDLGREGFAEQMPLHRGSPWLSVSFPTADLLCLLLKATDEGALSGAFLAVQPRAAVSTLVLGG